MSEIKTDHIGQITIYLTQDPTPAANQITRIDYSAEYIKPNGDNAEAPLTGTLEGRIDPGDLIWLEAIAARIRRRLAAEIPTY
jgi:hypothetical protein